MSFWGMWTSDPVYRDVDRWMAREEEYEEVWYRVEYQITITRESGEKVISPFIMEEVSEEDKETFELSCQEDDPFDVCYDYLWESLEFDFFDDQDPVKDIAFKIAECEKL